MKTEEDYIYFFLNAKIEQISRDTWLHKGHQKPCQWKVLFQVPGSMDVLSLDDRKQSVEEEG